MSKLPLVCFDASIRKEYIGIGINFLNSDISITEKIKVTSDIDINSLLAERIGLIKTLHVLKERNIKSAHLFTDNITLANEGISKKLQKNFKCITLNWLPRELNKTADMYSKLAHNNENIKIIQNKQENKDVDITEEMLKKYRILQLSRKIEILKHLSHGKKPLLDFIENKIDDIYFGKKDIKFFKMIDILFDENEYDCLNDNIEVIKKYIDISKSRITERKTMIYNIIDTIKYNSKFTKI